jgi:hypothetical protein
VYTENRESLQRGMEPASLGKPKPSTFEEAPMKFVTASANRDLDQILDLIGVSVQLTPTQFEKAETSYNAVGEWLQDDDSPVAAFDPSIFPQGSLLLDTTVKPLSHTEFDLDLVCLLLLSRVRPMDVYDMLLMRMRSHGRYAPIILPERRCIRIDYAGDFHLDIVPAIPDPDCKPGETCLLIPDREKKIWRPSNPKGYASWFDGRTQVRAAAFSLYERKEIEPLSAPEAAYAKPPLKLAVQLLKRWRDVAFEERMELAPSSIILTTLAGLLYRGEGHPTEALATILDGIHRWANTEPIRLQNPSNAKEWITDRWKDKPAMYDAFIEAIFDLRVRWHKLIEKGRFPDFIAELKALFTEVPVTRAVKRFAESRGEARRNGSLYVDKATGSLGVASAPAVIHGTLKVKDHAFHGE